MLILHPKAHTHFLGYFSFFVKMSIGYVSTPTCSIMLLTCGLLGEKVRGLVT